MSNRLLLRHIHLMTTSEQCSNSSCLFSRERVKRPHRARTLDHVAYLEARRSWRD